MWLNPLCQSKGNGYSRTSQRKTSPRTIELSALIQLSNAIIHETDESDERMCDSNCCAAGIGQLRTVLENLEHETDTVSRLLVRLLHVRDKRAGRLVAQYGKLTLVLRHFARRNSECVLLYQPLYSGTSEYRTVWGLAKSPLFGGIM